jgi:undecaprenyl-diphosphatase
VTFTVGLLGKLYGSPGPDLDVDESLIPARSTVLNGIFLTLHYVFSPPGNVVILALACLLLAFVLRKPLTALAFGSLVSVGWLSSEIGKLAIARLRPPASATQALVLEVGSDSFPSGHTAFATAFVWGAILVLASSRRQRIICGLAGAAFVAVVAFSRLYLGVHYPSDVLGAMLIATAGVLFWLPLWNKLIEPPLRRIPLLARMTGA